MVRKSLFWIHFAVGILAAIPLLAMSGTGVLLSFRPQILRLSETTVELPPPAGSAAPGLDSLVARAAGNRAARVTAVVLDSDPLRPVEVRVGKDASWRIDRGGTHLVASSEGLVEAFSLIERIHRWLGSREAGGGLVTGSAAVLCLVAAATGLLLWWPRNLRAALRVAWPRTGLRGRARDWQWHNATGILVLPLLLVLAGTGAVMSWKWAEALLFAATGSEALRVPERRGPAGHRAGSGPVASRGGAAVSDRKWQSWADSAIAHAPRGWTRATISAPRAPGGRIGTSFRAGGGPWTPGGTVELSPRGEFASWRPARIDLGMRLRLLVLPLHTGELLGWPGQLLMALASAGCLLLTWTGVALAWRRIRNRALSD